MYKPVSLELPDIFSALKIPYSNLEDIRLARWGHALPLAARGLIADGTLETASRPVANRIFFAQQDNWANPCAEMAMATARHAAAAVRRVLG